MSKIGFVAILLLIMGKSYSQENYFVLIQADNNQPFYAMLDGKTFSSTPNGHLILSRLKDSTYFITIGFPRDLFPEQQFSITVNKKDLRFQLKNPGEKGRGLFDPQTMELKMPVKMDIPENKRTAERVKKDDAFSRLMARVVNDTAVMYTDFAVEKQRTEDPGIASGLRPGVTQGLVLGVIPGGAKVNSEAIKADSGVVKANNREPQTGRSRQDSAMPALANILKDSTRNESSGKMEEPKAEKDSPGRKAVTPFVEKLSERRTDWLVKLVFVDHDKEGAKDTILVQIPLDSLPRVSAAGNRTRNRISKRTESSLVHGAPSRSGGNVSGPSLVREPDLPVIRPDSSSSSGATPKRIANNPVPTVNNSKPFLVNSDCSNFASDDDVDKLRAKMMIAVTDQDRIELALKVLRSKCFTSNQVKALNELFVNDEGRFGFFKAAYPFVTDSDQFKSLVSLLSDPPYIGRFKIMTGQQ